MKVLNPLFDSVFKYLLEDLDIAKAIVQAVIKQEITELTPAPQESSDFKIKLKYNQIGMIRQDYVAVIKSKTPDGDELYEKVMIEVQKSPIAPEITRFRNYIADKYRKKSTVEGEEKHLPIKTIYLIEQTFNEDLPAVLGRKGCYFDELENQPYTGKRDQIVELFTHDSWFIQTEKLPKDFKDNLMYVLSVFAPWYRHNRNDRYINLPDDEILRKKHQILERIYRRLQAATGDNEVNTGVEIELDYEKHYETILKEIEQAKQREEEAKLREEDERRQKEILQINSAKELKTLGVPYEKIAQITGLPVEVIEKL